MALIELIENKVVKIPLKAESKSDVIDELASILLKAGKISDKKNVVEGIHKREEQMSTGLGQGIAIPHCKTEAVSTLTIAVGISPEGIDFDSLDGELSNIFFLLLAAPDQSGPHLQALSEIASLTKSREFCRLLIEADSSAAVVNLFKNE